MRTLFLAAFLAISTSTVAMLKTTACPEPAPLCPYDNRWSGFTAGFTAGAWINASDGVARPTGAFMLPANLANNPLRTDSFDMHGAGFICGAQIGGNYQMKALVIGAETDFNYNTLNRWHHLHKTLAAPLVGIMNVRTSQLFNWFGTIRPRLGFDIKPVLLYVTGGFAYGHVSSKTEVSFSSAGDHYEGSKSKWPIGWTFGGGLEWGFMRHWSMKFEYLFLELQKIRYRDSNVPPPSFPTFAYKTRIKTEGHIVRIGFNYTI